MYNTVQELHIGIDLALQQLNSNRKQVVKPEEKDWFLNDTLLQVMNNHIDPSPVIPGRDSDSDQRAVDYLHPLKCDFKYIPPVVYSNNDNIYSISLPSDYYRKSRISAACCTERRKVAYSYRTLANDRLLKAVIPFIPRTEVDLTYYTQGLGFSCAGRPLFNAAKTLANDTAKKYDFSNVKTHSALFMMIPSIIEAINETSWASAYWEYYKGNHYPNSFVIIVDTEAYYNANGSFIIQDVHTILTANSHVIDVKMEYENLTIVDGGFSKIVPVRIVESAKFDQVNNNVFFDSSYHCIDGVIENGQIKLKGARDILISEINMTYYRKPKLINHKTGQSCEIIAEDFKVQLVNQTAQKINAFLNGENYGQMTKENMMLL